MTDLWAYENQARKSGHTLVAGVDEAGRGPLAGPVVAAAVILPENVKTTGINDSKALSHKKREGLFYAIYEEALSVGIGIVDALEIDRINILQASLLSMAFALNNLNPCPDFILVDGNQPIKNMPNQATVKKGDRLSISIAAASIIAKVTRDRLMLRYDAEYPQFGFEKHKGYPTAAHRKAIVTHGLCPIHRRSFRGAGGGQKPSRQFSLL